MVDIKQAKDYFFYIIENNLYSAEHRNGISIKAENGISYWVDLNRTTNKWDYLHIKVYADKYYLIEKYYVILTPDDLTQLGRIQQPSKLFNKKDNYERKKREADLLQKLLCDVQYNKTADLRIKLEKVSTLLSESMDKITKNPTTEKVKDFREKLNEMNAFIKQYEKS